MDLPDYQILFDHRIQNGKITIHKRKGSNRLTRRLKQQLAPIESFENNYHTWLSNQKLVLDFMSCSYPNKIELDRCNDIKWFQRRTGIKFTNVHLNNGHAELSTIHIKTGIQFVCLSRDKHDIGHMILINTVSNNLLDIYDPNGTPTNISNEGPYETKSVRSSIVKALNYTDIVEPTSTRIYINWDNKCIIASYLVYLLCTRQKWSFDQVSLFFESSPRKYIRRMILSLVKYLTNDRKQYVH